jgi:DNA-binding response OmpR family regulator
MEQTFHPPAGNPSRWDAWKNADQLARPVILLVEDDRDIRDMMCTLLELAGFAVVACETAESGLDALREQKFDLVLSDYALPGFSGDWLLETAEAEGLLQDTPVLIVTAHPDVKLARPYEVIQKPFDLDELVERIRRRMEGEGPRRYRAPSVPSSGPRSGGDRPDHSEPVELILYASSRSDRAAAAVEHLRKMLEKFSSSQVKLTVCELPPDAGDVCVAEAAALPPTLVRGTPGARTFILGHITNPELMLELLADCASDGN